MLTTKVLVKLSALIDALGLDLMELRSKDREEMGMKLFSSLIRNLHKAEKETYALIAAYKGITPEEAEETNAIEVIKELFADGGVQDFLS